MIPPLCVGRGLTKVYPDKGGWFNAASCLPEYGEVVFVKRFEKFKNTNIKHRYRVAYFTKENGWLDEYSDMHIRGVMEWKRP